MAKNTIRQALTILFITSSIVLQAQTSLLGQKGMVIVPEASIYEDGEWMFGLVANHQNYRYLYPELSRTRFTHELYYTAGVALIPRVNFFITLARLRGLTAEDRLGIGDRQAVLSVLALKERKYLPSIVVNISNPFATVNQYNSTNHLLATKRFELSGQLQLRTTLGYGVPYTFTDSGREDDPGYRFRQKESNYLNGFFGGVQFVHSESYYASLEHDSDKVNLGLGAELWNRLSLQINVLGIDRGRELGVGFGVRYRDVVR